MNLWSTFNSIKISKIRFFLSSSVIELYNSETKTKKSKQLSVSVKLTSIKHFVFFSVVSDEKQNMLVRSQTKQLSHTFENISIFLLMNRVVTFTFSLLFTARDLILLQLFSSKSMIF